METVAKKSFQEIINSDKPTLVDFFATWCGPCHAMTPVIQQLKSEMGEEVNVLKVDIDRNRAASEVFQVTAVPTFILFKDGKPVWRQSGVLPLHHLKKVISEHS